MFNTRRYKEHKKIRKSFREKYKLGLNFEIEVNKTSIRVKRKRYVGVLSMVKTSRGFQPTQIKKHIELTKPNYIPFREGERAVVIENG